LACVGAIVPDRPFGGYSAFERFITSFFKEDIMDCIWYREAIEKGRAEGIERERKDSIMRMARRSLPDRIQERLAAITDVEVLEEAFLAAHRAYGN